MSSTQLLLIAGPSTFTTIIGILLSQRSFGRLGDRIDGAGKWTDSRFDRIESQLDRIEADFRKLYRTIGQHEAGMKNLEKRGV